MKKLRPIRRRRKTIVRGWGYSILDDDALLNETIDGEMLAASLAEALSRGATLGFRLQKHEREALKAIRDVAKRHNVPVEVIRADNGPLRAILGTGRGRKIVSVPLGSADPHLAVAVTRKQATAACREIMQGAST